MIFFDPPFKWNCDDHPFFSFPNNELMQKMYPNQKPHGQWPSYYGIERYKSRSELAAYLYRAEKELYRVLKPDGCLWLRWCSMTAMDENNCLGVFADWEQMMKHEIGSSKRTTGGTTKSYWFMLMKKPRQYIQPELFSVPQVPFFASLGGNQKTEAKL